MSVPLRGRTTAVLLAVAALVGAANVGAYAATGRPLLLGRPNTAGNVTTLTRTNAGPALRLTTKAGSPPLAVGSGVKVAHLNADLVDGLDGAGLKTRAYRFTVPSNTTESTTQDVRIAVPAGTYLASYAVLATGAISGCHFDTAPPFRGLAYAVTSPLLTSVTASAVVTVGQDGLNLECFGSAEYTIYSMPGDSVSTIDLVRIDTLTKATTSVPMDPAARPSHRP